MSKRRFSGLSGGMYWNYRHEHHALHWDETTASGNRDRQQSSDLERLKIILYSYGDNVISLRRAQSMTKVLVVDDVSTNVTVLSWMLTHEGYSVTSAMSGQQALGHRGRRTA